VILSWVLFVAVFGPALLALAHLHGRRYARRRHTGLSVYASIRVPGMPRSLGARVGVSKRL
jgi:hypothetical protein